MILRWMQGRQTVDELLKRGALERVPANRALAVTYIEQARAHIRTSEAAAGSDPIGEFQLAYDAARKASASLLIAQGLRPTSRGGHIALHDAVMAQFDPPLGSIFREFAWMRPLRNDSEYPSTDRPVATADDAVTGRAAATKMAEAAALMIDELPTYGM